MPVDLIHLVNAVHDESSFLDFVRALSADRADEVKLENASPSSPWGPGANGWENGTIEAFLDAASAWGKDSARDRDGLPERVGPEPSTNPWRRCAEILLGGKHYE